MNGVEGIRGRAGEAVETFPTQSLLVNLCVLGPSPSLAFYSTWYLQIPRLSRVLPSKLAPYDPYFSVSPTPTPPKLQLSHLIMPLFTFYFPNYVEISSFRDPFPFPSSLWIYKIKNKNHAALEQKSNK